MIARKPRITLLAALPRPMCRRLTGIVVCALAMAMVMSEMGCSTPAKPYGTEQGLFSPLPRRQVWAVAPAVNLSGEPAVDALLQGDLFYQQLQQVQGLIVVPVNRVAEVYAALRIERVQNEKQAALVCDLLGCQGLMVPTITAYDPYNPPKMGASVQLFLKPAGYVREASLSPRDLVRQMSPQKQDSLPVDAGFVQVVGMFDASNGSVRDALKLYAAGRNDPAGPYAEREYLVCMDRYCSFVYYRLIAELIGSPKLKQLLG